MEKPIINKTNFKFWFESRKLNNLQYQYECIDKINEHLFSNKKPAILAACPSAGKTSMTILYIDQYIKANPTAKVLVLTHGTKVLRNQFAYEIEKLKPDFTFSEVIPKDKNFDSQVIIAIPQTLKNVSRLPKFDLVVVDEAHHFYLAKVKDVEGQVMRLIKKCKPTHQLLLTGTPSKFILNKYEIIPITINELLDYNMVTDVVVELASSTYNFTNDDYNNDKELKSDVVIKKSDTDATMDILIDHILKRLKSINRLNPTAYSTIKNITNWSGALSSLKKTMIACKTQAQAKQVQQYLEKKNINVALSISDEDKDSSQIERFKNDPKCLVLVVVNRGILGFNLPELENVIDMTCSQNADVIFQLLGRVLRKHPDGHQKLFFKVVPHTMAEWFDHLMTLVMCLTDKEYYTKYNGKNFMDMEIPVIKEKRIKSFKESKENKSKRKPVDFKKIDFEGVPAIRFFNDLLHQNRSILNGYEWTTMRTVKQRIFEHKNAQLTLEEFIQRAIEVHPA